MELLKLCVNCRFYVGGNSASEDRCGHLDNTVTDWVRGAHIMGFCDTRRRFGGNCGPEGKLFIQKDLPSILEENTNV